MTVLERMEANVALEKAKISYFLYGYLVGIITGAVAAYCILGGA